MSVSSSTSGTTAAELPVARKLVQEGGKGQMSLCSGNSASYLCCTLTLTLAWSEVPQNDTGSSSFCDYLRLIFGQGGKWVQSLECPRR